MDKDRVILPRYVIYLKRSEPGSFLWKQQYHETQFVKINENVNNEKMNHRPT
jgi:hypothetical protein